jgi:hypothetical protein
MIFIDVARYLRRTWPELFVVEPGFAGLHRRIDPCRYDRPRLAVGWAKAPDATDRRTAGKIRLDHQLFAKDATFEDLADRLDRLERQHSKPIAIEVKFAAASDARQRRMRI